jgi:type I restriction enzyme S subunit
LVIADKWRDTTLGEIVELKRGYDLPSRDRRVGPFPIVSSSGVSGYHAEAKAKAPGVVIGRYGTLGEVHYVTKDYWPLNTSLYVRDFKGNDPRFLSYLLRCLDFLAYSDKAAVPGLNRNDLHTSRVRVPPLSEQRAIAAILGALDDKIELNRRMNETLEAMARAIFKSWFVDFESVRAKMEGRWRRGQSLPGLPADLYDLVPNSFKDSEPGEIPKGWHVGKFGDIADNARIGISPEQIPAGAVYVGLEHIPKRSIALDSWGTSDGLESGKFRFSAGDILFGKLRPYFHKVAVAPEGGVCSTDILVIRPKSPEWAAFTMCLASSTEVVEYASALADGTRMPRTNWHDLARYEIALPPLTVAAIFDRQTAPWIQSIQENIRESRILATIRDALLPKLLSGEIRVRDIEPLVKEAV